MYIPNTDISNISKRLKVSFASIFKVTPFKAVNLNDRRSEPVDHVISGKIVVIFTVILEMSKHHAMVKSFIQTAQKCFLVSPQCQGLPQGQTSTFCL